MISRSQTVAVDTASSADTLTSESHGKRATASSITCQAARFHCGRSRVSDVGQTAGFGGDTLEDVVDESVHDAHGLAGDSGVGVDLLQHLVDVDSVALLPALPLALLVGLGDSDAKSSYQQNPNSGSKKPKFH
ncbi:hypothetical protein B566_EDAN014637 [Ephemera danica]|nr:hypothetical protein B566_EDAN014637 [Ephemera danica]